MSNWSKPDVLGLIAEALTPVVAAAGFQFRKRRQAFVRDIAGGRQELGVALTDRRPLYEFSFTLCIRLEAVQEIVNRFSGSLPEFHDETMTSVTQLEHLGVRANSPRGVVYPVRSAAELQAAMPPIQEWIRRRAVPFFEQHRDVATVNQGLNPAGGGGVLSRFARFLLPGNERRAFDATNQPYRALSGATVASLAGDARLPSLIQAYRRQLRGAQPQERQKFENLCAFLTTK